MSDHDRGAYTPQSDAPLSFDARQAQGRRAFPTTLVLSLLILAALGIAIFMFYRSGVRAAGEAPAPVGTPVGEIKAPPPAQAGSQPDAASSLQIYKAEGGAPAAPSSAPVFAAPPEQPQPRPAPATRVEVAPTHAAPASPAPLANPSVVAASGATMKAAPPKPASASVAATRPAPNAAPGDAIGDLLKSKPAVPAKSTQPAKTESAPFSAVQGAALVQFGAFSSHALAGDEWSKLAGQFPSDMAGKGKVVESVERNGKTLYRGAVSGFASHADAAAFCAKLKAAGRDCIVR
jgi:hypothetical protein